MEVYGVSYSKTKFRGKLLLALYLRLVKDKFSFLFSSCDACDEY